MIARAEAGPTRDRAIALGIADEAGLREMQEDWTKWADAEDGYCGLINGEVVVYL